MCIRLLVLVAAVAAIHAKHLGGQEDERHEEKRVFDKIIQMARHICKHTARLPRPIKMVCSLVFGAKPAIAKLPFRDESQALATDPKPTDYPIDKYITLLPLPDSAGVPDHKNPLDHPGDDYPAYYDPGMDPGFHSRYPDEYYYYYYYPHHKGGKPDHKGRNPDDNGRNPNHKGGKPDDNPRFHPGFNPGHYATLRKTNKWPGWEHMLRKGQRKVAAEETVKKGTKTVA